MVRANSLCCDLEGFSLHAKVAIEGHGRGGLERLCRYIARPAIAGERLSLDPDGRVVYRLRRAWRDGTSAMVFEPLVFLERLAAPVPRPRAHLLTYHGVLAPAAQWRDEIVPGTRARAGSHVQDGGPACSHGSPAAPLQRAATRTSRSTWAELLRRVCAVDVLTCPDCGGTRRLIATITDGLAVRRILDHLELPSSPPPRAPARAPPEPESAWWSRRRDIPTPTWVRGVAALCPRPPSQCLRPGRSGSAASAGLLASPGAPVQPPRRIALAAETG